MLNLDWQPSGDVYQRAAVIKPGRASRCDKYYSRDWWYLAMRHYHADHVLTLTLIPDTLNGRPFCPDSPRHFPPTVWELALHASWTTVAAGTRSSDCSFLGRCFVVRSSTAGAKRIWEKAPQDLDDLGMTPERLLALDAVWEEMARVYDEWIRELLPQKRTLCPHCQGEGLLAP